MQNAVYLFCVKFGKLLLGHHVDKEVVTDLRVSINALRVSLSYTLSKNTWVFRIE
jgi:hypothetical protein